MFLCATTTATICTTTTSTPTANGRAINFMARPLTVGVDVVVHAPVRRSNIWEKNHSRTADTVSRLLFFAMSCRSLNFAFHVSNIWDLVVRSFLEKGITALSICLKAWAIKGLVPSPSDLIIFFITWFAGESFAICCISASRMVVLAGECSIILHPPDDDAVMTHHHPGGAVSLDIEKENPCPQSSPHASSIFRFFTEEPKNTGRVQNV